MGPSIPERGTPSTERLGWWAVPLVTVVIVVNVAGVWEIGAALRGLREHAELTVRLEAASRARVVEGVLSGATADLAFLAGSAVPGLDAATAGPRWRDELGAALLLFLRGHQQVRNLVVRDATGAPLIEAGRPRGVPGFWIPGPTAPSLDLRGAPLRREFEIRATAAPPGAPSRLDALLDPASLVGFGPGDDSAARVICALFDATGSRLAGTDEPDGIPAAEVEVAAAGWSAPAPWRLRCAALATGPTAALEPLVARHRTTIALNLIVMVLAVGLGAFAIHQSRRRREFESRAREEARVRELERRLFHAERLSTVGRLAAGMAHEINNPLEGISNYLRLAGEALDRAEPGRARRALERVQQGVERAAGIVRRVLDHADPSAALHEVVELGQVVAQAVEFVRTREEFAGIRFEIAMPVGGARVRGSAVMLGQVMLNLVLNACEAQPDGGEVVVRCRREGRWIDTEVLDRGPGVTASRRSRIFEPFETTKQSAGLGLSICHSIVERHEGELAVHPREGGGSVFRVRLVNVDERGERDRA